MEVLFYELWSIGSRWNIVVVAIYYMKWSICCKCFYKVEPESLWKHNQQHHCLQRLLSAPRSKPQHCSFSWDWAFTQWTFWLPRTFLVSLFWKRQDGSGGLRWLLPPGWGHSCQGGKDHFLIRVGNQWYGQKQEINTTSSWGMSQQCGDHGHL